MMLRKQPTDLMRVCPHGNPERARETKVGELEVVMFIDQKILGLEVPVEDTMRMAVQKA